MANDASKDLFFPSAASYLAQVATILGELKKAADDIKGAAADLEGSYKKDDLGGIIKDIRKVKGIAENLVDDFDELKEELPE
jgi:hypothetical protein